MGDAGTSAHSGRYNRAANVVAHHEAGHAVMARHFGRPVSAVSIVEDESSRGRARHKVGPASEVEVDDSDLVRMKVEHQVCIALAGYLAGRRAAPRSDRGAGSLDHRVASDWLHRIASSAEVPHYFKLLSLRTDRLLEARWNEVEAVAKALLERKKLDRGELLAVIDEARRLRIGLAPQDWAEFKQQMADLRVRRS